jgi:hypothetical protein
LTWICFDESVVEGTGCAGAEPNLPNVEWLRRIGGMTMAAWLVVLLIYRWVVV